MGLLTILYQDEHLVAIDKPDGLLVHRTRISRDHVFAMQLVRDQLGRFVYPVHRLDRPTSGVLLFALDKSTASSMGCRFAEREVEKEYLAVVRGHTEPSATIDYALRESSQDESQHAVTTYSRLNTVELATSVTPHLSARYSLLKVQPLTGRMHQIRKHMKHISHPIIGDTQHGDGKHNRLFRDDFNIRRLLLHARRITFRHPADNADITIESPLPEAMATLFNEFGWR